MKIQEEETMELTLHQEKITSLKSKGASHKEIGEILGMEEHAASQVLSRLYKKFGARSSVEFVLMYLEYKKKKEAELSGTKVTTGYY